MEAKFEFFYGQGSLYFNSSLIIYTEHEYNSELNEYIQKNYEVLSGRFAKNSKTFLYIPRLTDIIDSQSRRYLTGRHEFNISNPENTGDALKSALPSCIYDKLPYPSLTHFGETDINGFRLDVFDTPEEAFRAYFEDIEPKPLTSNNEILLDYVTDGFGETVFNIDNNDETDSKVSESESSIPFEEKVLARTKYRIEEEKASISRESIVRFRRKEHEESDIRFRDEDYDEVDKVQLKKELCEPEDKKGVILSTEDFKLIKQARENVEQLLGKGLSIDLIYALIKPQLKPSRLVITKDFRIFLPDYDNLEIKLGPIDKTVFFFYLRHPEGVGFKYLSDYKVELKSIYRKVTNRMFNLFSPIDSLVDSTNNSINEKCSHIRRVFIANLAVPLASEYYITGERGEDKRIRLDRSLVKWECEI